MKDLSIIVAAVIGIIVLAAGIIIYSAFAWGFVVYRFWDWFILPVFKLPVLTYYQAVGVSIFISLFRNIRIETKIKKEYLEESTKYDWISGLLLPWIVLITAYIIHLLIK